MAERGITLIVKVTRNDNIHDFPYIANTLGREHMRRAVRVVKDMVRLNAPEDTGKFKRSIRSAVEAANVPKGSAGATSGGAVITGSVFSTDEPGKVEALEMGRPSGSFVPTGPLYGWVIRKTSLFGSSKRGTVLASALQFGILRDTTFAINLDIFQEGIVEVGMFKKSQERTKDMVDKIMNVELNKAIAEMI